MHDFTRMSETYLKKAPPTDAERFRAMSETLFRQMASIPAFNKRLMELDGIIAAPVKTGDGDEWQLAMQGLDTYANDALKEALEEREFVLERKRFAEQAIAKGLPPWGSVWGVVSAQVAAQETPELIKDIQEEVVNPLLKARAGFRKLQARRDRHEENGVRTDNSWPCNVAPTLVEHINLYLDWISKNYSEVQTSGK